MIKNVDGGNVSDGCESDAANAFLEELRRGPFAPALSSSILDGFGLKMKLTEFLYRNLDDQVIAIFNQAKSPVGRPALCLRAQVHNPAYWRGGEEGFVGYRLSSLAASAWEEGCRNLDMSVLDDGDITFQGKDARPCTSDMDMADFLKVFKVGVRFFGKVERRAHGAQGWIVTCETEGLPHRCFMPDSEVGQVIVNPGFSGEFECIATLPQKRSVLVRPVSRIASEFSRVGKQQPNSLAKQLKESASLLAAHGILTDSEYATVRNRIFDLI